MDKHEIPTKDKLSLFYTMKKIRMVEEKIGFHYREDEMRTPIHLCIGQEAVAAGVCANLTKEDLIFSNHRNHGHYIAKGGDLNRMIAELYNKETGCCKGRGGSMHMMDMEAGIPVTSAIVAGGIPIATGSALTAKLRGTNEIAIAFLGDAASEEGVVYESLCFAALKKLPIVYVCENNLYSVGTHILKRQIIEDVYKKFEGILPCAQVDGNDVLAVYKAANSAIERARAGEGPSFIECKTYRLTDHHDTKTGVAAGYQSKEEWDWWADNCPIETLRKKLLGTGELHVIDEKRFEEALNEALEFAFGYAKESPLPQKSTLYKGLFA